MTQNADSVDSKLLSRLKEAIAWADSILIAAHRNPDGDAVGSLLGMYFILEAMSKKATAFCPDGIPQSLAFLPGAETVEKSLGNRNFDATVLLDTPQRSLFAEGFESRGIFIVIDHHKKHDDFGDLVIRYPSAAVGEMLYCLARAAGWPVDRRAAVCLYTSIVSDTASFRYESTTPRTHEVAADLIALGADPKTVSSHLFESFSLARRRLLAAVLETLEIAAGGRYAQLHCTRRMIRDAGASKEDLEGMVNFARGIAGVELAALLREEDGGKIRVSLRSKGAVNASAAAERFGGGGHVNAAGVRLSGTTMGEALLSLKQHAEAFLAAC
jgi:bifunctional oligoribonuclease and PAP phosphatase NrnA